MNKVVSSSLILRLIVCSVLLLLALFIRQWILDNFLFAVQDKEETRKEFVSYGRLTRSYIIHLPQKEKDYGHAVPLVFMLHGVSGNADFTMERTELNEIADKNNFIVVYPNGTGLFNNYVLSWNAGQCCNFVEPLGVDDVGYIKFLIEKFKKEYNIDENKIYVAGMSNGAMMAYRLGCELADDIASIAPVAGSLMIDECRPAEPISVMAIHGKKDEVVPFSGGVSDNMFVDLFGLDFRSVKDSVDFWVKNNKCNKIPESKRENGFWRELYKDCEYGTEVLLYTFDGYGHVWPGGKKVAAFVSKPPEGFSTSKEVWEFFVGHSKGD